MSEAAPEWIAMPPEALKGEGLQPYPEGATSNLFDWAENPQAASRHLMPHFGQFIVDIVEIEDNAVHQPSKPGDELVIVLNGILSLTTDGGAVEQTYRAGEMVLIPAGWAGIYRMISENGPFRELAIVPFDYFENAPIQAPSGQSPRRLTLPTKPGRHELHRNRYALEAVTLDRAGGWDIEARSDEIIRILTGSLVLSTPGESGNFGPGSLVILPVGFAGRAEASAGYRSLTARWIG
jgi:uncharacterized cupin superfamily protein